MISPIPNSTLINYQKALSPQGLSNHNRMLSSISPNNNNHYQILNSPNIQQANYNLLSNNNNNYNAIYINQKFPPQSQFNYCKGNAFFENPINYNYNNNNISNTIFTKTINNNTINNIKNINNIQIHNKIPLSNLSSNNIHFINRNNNFLNQTLNRNNSQNNFINNMNFYQQTNNAENMHLENLKFPVKKNNSNISKDKVIKRNGKPITNIDMNSDVQGDLSCSGLKKSFNNKNIHKNNDNNNYNTININMLNNNEIDKNYKVKKIQISPFSLSNDKKNKNSSKVKKKLNTINDNNPIKANITQNASSNSKKKNIDSNMETFDISINNHDKTIKNNTRIKTIHGLKDSNNIKIIKGKDNESNKENNKFINNHEILNSEKILINDYNINIDKNKTISNTNNIDNFFKNKTPDQKEEKKYNYINKKNNESIKGIIMMEKSQRRNKTPSVSKRNNVKSNNFNNITEISSSNREDSIKLNNKNTNNINFLTIKNMNNISSRNKSQISPNKNKIISIKPNKNNLNLPLSKVNNIKENIFCNDNVNDTEEKLNKDKIIENLSLNPDKEEDFGEIKINNLLNKLESKIKFTTSIEKETIDNINNINKIKTNITNNNEQKKGTKIQYSKDVNYFKYCIYKSSAGKDSFGKRKVNQDVYLVKINMIDIEGFNLFGVLDGHGENGHLVSRFARNFITEEIQKKIQKSNKKSLSEIYSLLIKDNYSLIKKVYQKVDKELSKQNFNANFSGSTCVIVFQIGNNLISANIGDSRAILIQSENANDDKLEKAKVIELSIDQKPDLPEEKKRIYKMGGIVDQMLDGNGKRNGPFRVWAGKQNYPGIAMSRSFGDLKGKKCGLISEPEIIEYKLDEKCKYMVICSDGVWEFLSNEDVMNIGIKYYINNDINGYINDIIQLSQYWWKKEDIVIDDITSVIVFF